MADGPDRVADPISFVPGNDEDGERGHGRRRVCLAGPRRTGKAAVGQRVSIDTLAVERGKAPAAIAFRSAMRGK